jgi:serine/threonine protein kinase
MGEVYRARDTRLERTVAIKILPAHLSSDPTRKQRFEREAKTISSLNHPHICVLYDVGHQNGVDYLVMECVEGETLAQRLQKSCLPLEQVLRFGAQIADALDKAHRNGVVHRDLKPGNIMLTSSGAKLLDFGLAKPAAGATLTTVTLAAPAQSPVTQEGTIVGTFQYMSPEQLEGKEVDGRSDIFSLGAVLYEMVTGQHAFEGKSQLSVASAILEKEPAPITTIKPLTPPALERAIRKCLAKAPDEHWQSASDLASELKWISESGEDVAAGRLPEARGRFAWGMALMAIILLTIALAVVVTYHGKRPMPEPPLLCDCTLTKNRLSVLYEDHALLELTNPVPANRAISAQMTEIASMWGKLGEHVSEMDVLFEVVSPTVRQNPVVQKCGLRPQPKSYAAFSSALVSAHVRLELGAYSTNL